MEELIDGDERLRPGGETVKANSVRINAVTARLLRHPPHLD
jgi:hypothetical protein